MKLIAYPLLPFSFLYGGILRSRNWLYDRGFLASHTFTVPTINVGNLTVGGTGKTPHVEYLVRLLNHQSAAILSRGYKRQTRGFVLADVNANAATIGDEPYQFYMEFPGTPVAVCENRVTGIRQLLALRPETGAIVLDDAFQHRPVRADLNILITDYHRLFFNDWVLPAGRLREGRAGARRADVVVVSKCPDNLPEKQRQEIRERIQPYCLAGTPVFFSGFRYRHPVGFGRPGVINKKIILVTGIARPEPLRHYLTQNGYEVVKHFNFPDHHLYSQQDIAEISNFADSFPGSTLLTTQKDWTKLMAPGFDLKIRELPIFYLPIEVYFLADQELFDHLVLKTAVKDTIAT